MKYISEVPNAPSAIGPYSPAVIAGGFAFLSGQIPINPETGKLVGETIQDQSAQVLKNISSILEHLNLDFSKVVKTTIFLTDLANFQIVNGIYEKALGGSKPARSTIQVAGLPMGAKIEIEMVAAL